MGRGPKTHPKSQNTPKHGVYTIFLENFRERKLNPNFFFSNFSGAPGISRRNPGMSRQKNLISLVSRGIPNFLAPTPSCGRPLPHRKISGLKSLGLGSFFVPETSRELFPAFLWPESVTQRKLFRKTCSDELFLILGGFYRVDFPPLMGLLWNPSFAPLMGLLWNPLFALKDCFYSKG